MPEDRGPAAPAALSTVSRGDGLPLVTHQPLHPVGLFDPSTPCLALVRLVLGGSPSSPRWPSLLSRWCWLIIGQLAR
jgi:hypothetical protein